MKAIMIMYDSLNRHMLAPYGCEWTKTPNFERLAERCVTFDKCYVGSLPCMPARREIHTVSYTHLDVYKRQDVPAYLRYAAAPL